MMGLTALAADTQYESLNNTATVIHFDGKEWYLVDYDSSTVTLLKKECITASPYDLNNSGNAYSGSTVETVVNDYYTDNITESAKKVVNGNGMFLLTIEKARALINDIRKCSKYPSADLNWWWLSSPGAGARLTAVVDGDNGKIDNDGVDVYYSTLGVRPALKLDLSSVTFDPSTKTFETVNSGAYSRFVNTTMDI